MNDINKISFPVLVVADDGWMDFKTDSKGLSRWNCIAINKYNKRKVLLYDSSDTLWSLIEIIPEKPVTFLRLLLAETFYNPTVDVSFKLEKIKDNITDKIFAAINKAIDADDDSTTQFTEADDLKKSIEGKSSFNDIVTELKGKQAI